MLQLIHQSRFLLDVEVFTIFFLNFGSRRFHVFASTCLMISNLFLAFYYTSCALVGFFGSLMKILLLKKKR